MVETAGIMCQIWERELEAESQGLTSQTTGKKQREQTGGVLLWNSTP